MAVLCNKEITKRMASGFGGSVDHTNGSNNVIAIFKGTMPTNTTNWVVADSSSDLLVSFTNLTLRQSSQGDQDRVVFDDFPTPASVNATATGTASWFAFYQTGVTSMYFFGDVSVAAGTGTLVIDDLSVTSGNPVTIENFGIQFTTS